MSSRVYKLAAVAVGVLMAAAPLAVFKLWLDDYVRREGAFEVQAAANHAVGLAEQRLGMTIDELDKVAARGVASCRNDHLEVLRSANFSASPVKEFSIIGPDGRTLCSDLGAAPGERAVVASGPIAGRADAALELVQVGSRQERFLRLRRPTITGANVLAALLPPDLLLTPISAAGGPVLSQTQMRLAGGAIVGEAGPAALPTESFVASARSERFGLSVMVLLPRSVKFRQHQDLESIGYMIAGAMALLLFGFAALRPRRTRDNPVVEIEKALKAGEFVPYYQPVIDITTARIRGAEVLMRWRKPDGTIIPPGHFIPLAESSGLIAEMMRHLMRAVRDEMGDAVIDRPFLRFGFNLSACHFRDDSIVADVREIFEGSTIRLAQLVLELTERHPLDNLTSARRVIAALQGLGVKVAIDDVGAGHSGLSYILKLGVDIIKIDKIFIDALGHDSNSTTIIETLMDLARNLRMDVIAEGVENFEQVVALRERGIRAAQGYVFAPPLPGSAFLQLIEATDPVASVQEATLPARRPLALPLAPPLGPRAA